MPEQIGRYVLEQKLGAGGMAEVWLATQLGPTGFKRRCVIKRVLANFSSDRDLVTMFLDEARLAAQLNHPNIIQILDFGEHEGTYFIAMEYVPGKDLRYVLRRRTAQGLFIPYPVAARLVSLVAQALDFAHQAVSSEGVPLKLVHRDVTPHNILVSTSGGVKLIDFGIAKAATARRKTKTGVVKGKFTYMSPEQLRGEALDGRSDLFALGLVLWEVLAGRPAVPRDSTGQIVQTILKGEFPRLDTIRSDVPKELVAVVDRALKSSPADRYARGTELSLDLERYLVGTGGLLTPADLGGLIPADASLPALPAPSLDPPPPSGAETRATRLEESGGGLPAAPASPTAPTAPASEVPAPRTPVVRTVDFERPDRSLLWRRALGAALLVASVVGAAVLGRSFYGTALPVPDPVKPLAALPSLPPEPPRGETAGPGEVPPPPVDARTDDEALDADPQPAPAQAPGARVRTHAKVKPGDRHAAPAAAVNLTVRSEVPARVSIDGEPRGLAPIFVSVKPGEHAVAFRSDSLGTTHAEQVHLGPADAREVVWRPGRGKLTLWVMPYGEVFLDGKSIGITPLPAVEVWEGRHSLRFANSESGRSVQREVQVSAGSEQTVKINLGE